MREIKFRAWDTSSKKMVAADDLIVDGNGKIYEVMSGELVAQLPHLVLMQYTGLKDKNGKEIYEGDIVRCWFPGMPHDMRTTQGIMFFDGCFGCGDYPLKFIDKITIEVIGNIYQNPELLEK